MPTGKDRPTIRDVAAEAGVGVMTVSYAFSKPDRVAAATRNRVLEVARRLGYRPDTTARALRSGRTGQLGVVLSEHLSYAFDDPQAAAFLAGVADVCVEDELGMVLIPTRGAASDVDHVLAAAVDAYVLWTTTEDDPVLAAIAGSGRPAAIQGGPQRPGIPCVASDDYEAAKAVTNEALAYGDWPVVVSFPLDRRRTAQVATGCDLSGVAYPVTRERLRGYRDALSVAGHDWADVPVAVVERNQRDHGRAAARELLTHVPAGRTPVVLAMSDELALGARDALTPSHPAATISGWDGSTEAVASAIITVSNPLRAQGRLCARVALDPTRQIEPIPWHIRGPAVE